MTKYKLQVTGNFKQDVKRCKKRGLPLQELWDVVEMLLCGETLPVKFHGCLNTDLLHTYLTIKPCKV